MQAFACWAHNPPPELPWEAVDDFVVQHLPQLLRVTWMVPPHQDMEALRCNHCTSLPSFRTRCPDKSPAQLGLGGHSMPLCATVSRVCWPTMT